MRPVIKQLLIAGMIVGTGLWAQYIIGKAPDPLPPLEEEEKSVAVSLAVALRGDVERQLSGLGDLKPLRHTVLRAEVSGIVMGVNSRRLGQAVEHGDVVLSLDPRDLDAAVVEAEAQVESATASRERQRVAQQMVEHERSVAEERAALAAADVGRQEKLLESKLVSPLRVEQARMQEAEQRGRLATTLGQLSVLEQELPVARAGVKLANAALASARLARSKTEIHAPYPAVLVARSVEIGDRVGPGTELLEIQDQARLRVVIPVPASRIAQIHLASAASVFAPDLGNSKIGEVTEIRPRADTRNRTFDVVVEIDNSQAPWYPGHFAEVEIEVPRLQDAISVPETAIAYGISEDGSSSTSVYVLDPDSGRFRLRSVRVQEIVGPVAVIADGLEADEQVADSSLDLLFDGVLYRALDESQNATDMASQPKTAVNPPIQVSSGS